MRHNWSRFLLICVAVSASACEKKAEAPAGEQLAGEAAQPAEELKKEEVPKEAGTVGGQAAVPAVTGASAATDKAPDNQAPGRKPSQEADNQLSCTGSNGVRFAFRFGRPKVGELFSVDISATRTGAPLPDGLTLRADATMPEHGHGMMTKPETKSVGLAQWRSEGWKFNMHGKWQLEAEVTGAVADRCTVAFEQPPETAL